MRDGDVEEIERDAPVAVELVGPERLDPVPGDPLDGEFVDQGGEFAREVPGVGRRGGDEQGLVGPCGAPPVGLDRNDGVAHRLAPGDDQPRQQHAPRDGAERLGQSVAESLAGAGVLEQELGVVERAERHDAGQQCRGAAEPGASVAPSARAERRVGT